MNPLSPPHMLKERLARLDGRREAVQSDVTLNRQQQQVLQEQIELAGQVSGALQFLSGQLFEDLLTQLEKSLTLALQDVLEQPIRLVTETDFKYGHVSIRFVIERDGNAEHVLHGQGGSVANVLSVGLRMFALAGLKEHHRQLLVLDEPDCWLQPELVPKLVHIIKLAGEQLGIQVILISHHQAEYFSAEADRMFRLLPGQLGVRVETIKNGGSTERSSNVP